MPSTRVPHLLDNIIWNAMSGPQRDVTEGTARARRFARGFSPILGFSDLENPSLDDVRPFAQSGESFYTGDWSGPVPPGWRLEEESTMFRMVWSGEAEVPQAFIKPVPLGPHHAEQALALAQLTKPGPFGLRTIELGEYFGLFDDSRLIAMAGERMRAGAFCEISGVCVHPEFQGRGLARQLMVHLLGRQLGRGAIPFLHAMRANEIARAFYERLGFRSFKEPVVRVVTLC